MVCDKCGFEHNSRSVCPKCGARVIYVNEDYLRRKKEWEEAQKKGGSDMLPPGIMHSTRDDYDKRHGNDRTTDLTRRHNEEGRSEMTGLSFAVIKEKLVKVIAKLIVTLNKHKKKRGANNPVIRDLKFEKEEDRENLDNSKLVLSHKVFKDHRKIIIMAFAAVFVLIAGGITAFKIIQNIDHSSVVYFDGKFAYTGSGEELFGDASADINIVSAEDGYLLGCGESALFAYKKGTVSHIDASSPQVIAYSNRLESVIFADENGGTYYTDFESTSQIAVDGAKGFTDGCMMSDGGDYFAVTTNSGSEDFSFGNYTTYLGEKNGEVKVISDTQTAKEILRVTDDGDLWFVEMGTADYGVINSKNLVHYIDGGLITVVSNMSDYYFDGENFFFINGNSDLYEFDFSGAPTQVDMEVDVFLADDNSILPVVYQKGNIVYTIEDYLPKKLCYAEKSGAKLYCGASFMCYELLGELYFVQKYGEEAALLGKISGEPVYFDAENSILAVCDGTLYSLNSSGISEISGDVDQVFLITNYGFGYMKNGSLYTGKGLKKKAKMLREFDGSVSDMCYSEKYFYLLDEKNILAKISKNGKNLENIGFAKYVFFWKNK